MQKKNNILTKTALAIIAAVLATGCIFEKMDMPKNLQNVLIEINVSADELQTKSEPSDVESAINTLHIYAFSGDALAGYYEGGATAVNEPFLMDMLLPEGTSVPVEFYLIANASSMKDHSNPVELSDDMTKADLEALKYTGIVAGTYLPLYCKESKNIDTSVYTANEEEGHEEHLLLVEKVHFTLSRSIAKLSVYGAKPEDSTSEPQIISVTMLAAGTREYSYLYPQTDDVLDAVPSRVNDRILLAEGNPVTLETIGGDGTSSDHYTPVVVSPTYVPEISAGGTIDGWASMTSERQMTLKIEYVLRPNGDIKTGFVYMPRIERNKHYKVCILVSEENEGNINITYEVADWDNHDMPTYTFTYPLHTYLMESVPTTSADESDPTSPATMSETSPFVGYFQMQAPENDEWMPTLVGAHAADAEIKVYDYETDAEIPSTSWPIAASPKWYIIEVIPNADLEAGSTVDLAITYQPDLVTSAEYLLINGSAGNYYWPDSSDENFVTITMVN